MLPFVVAAFIATPLTLGEVQQASRQNLDALRAELELARTDEGRKVARAAVLPQVQMQSQLGMIAVSPQRQFNLFNTPGAPAFFDTDAFVRGNFLFGVTLTQLLYDGGKWWNELERTGEVKAAAEGQLAEQRLSSEVEAVRRFYELLRAQSIARVLQAGVERSEAQLDRAKGYYEAGRAQKRDAIDAEVNLANDRIRVLRQNPVVTKSRVDLLSWLARSPHDQVEAADPGILVAALEPSPSLETAVQLARERRPLWKVLDAQVRAAELAVSVAKAPFFPRVSAQVGYQRQSPTADPFFTDPTRQNSLNLGVVLQWDVFSGFATVAQTARARRDLDEAGLRRAQQLRDMEGELASAIASVEAQLEIARLADQSLKLAEAGLMLAEERFKAGAGSTLEQRDAALKLTQAQLERLQSRIDLAIARSVVDRLTAVRGGEAS